MYRRGRLKIKALRTGDPSDRSNFKKLRNEVNNSIKNAKKSYYYKTFETYNGNSRKTWETITEVTRRKSDKTTVNELELNGAGITNSTEIAEGFNKSFAEIGPELSPISWGGRSARVVRLRKLCSNGKPSRTKLLHYPQMHNIVRAISKLMPRQKCSRGCYQG